MQTSIIITKIKERSFMNKQIFQSRCETCFKRKDCEAMKQADIKDISGLFLYTKIFGCSHWSGQGGSITKISEDENIQTKKCPSRKGEICQSYGHTYEWKCKDVYNKGDCPRDYK